MVSKKVRKNNVLLKRILITALEIVLIGSTIKYAANSWGNYQLTLLALEKCDKHERTINKIVSGEFEYMYRITKWLKKESQAYNQLGLESEYEDLEEAWKILPKPGDSIKSKFVYVDLDSNLFRIRKEKEMSSFMHKHLQYARDKAYKQFMNKTKNDR